MVDWRHWHNEPYLVGGLVLLGWLWAILAGPYRTRLVRWTVAAYGTPLTGRIEGGQPEVETPYPRGHAWKFYSALALFYFAVGSPLDQIGERFLFSVHMLQHQLLIYPAAVLFLLGLPWWMVDGGLLLISPTLPLKQTASLGGRTIRWLGGPVVCALVSTLVISVWHMPYLYDGALGNKLLHVLEHLMFFGAALFYWWPMLSPSRLLPPISYAAQMLYFFAVLIGMTPIFAYITFSDDILYPTYEYAPRLFHDFTAASDQLLAGAGMKIVGMLVALGAIGVSFSRWYQQGQEQDRQSLPSASK
jgi:putative membrane protein